MTSGGKDWFPVQTCSLQDFTVQGPPPVLTSGDWILKHEWWTSGRYVSYWNVVFLLAAREGNVFTGVCQLFCPQSASWLLVHCSSLLQRGRYASYWNAFLFTCIFSWELNHVFDWLISYWCTRSETRLFIHYVSFALTPGIDFYSLLPCFIDVAIFFWPQFLCGSCVSCWVLLRRRLYDNSCQQWDIFISHVLRM